jgi:hypothetical protein
MPKDRAGFKMQIQGISTKGVGQRASRMARVNSFIVTEMYSKGRLCMGPSLGMEYTLLLMEIDTKEVSTPTKATEKAR